MIAAFIDPAVALGVRLAWPAWPATTPNLKYSPLSHPDMLSHYRWGLKGDPSQTRAKDALGEGSYDLWAEQGQGHLGLGGLLKFNEERNDGNGVMAGMG